MDGVAEVGHAADDRQKFLSHLSAEVGVTARGETDCHVLHFQTAFHCGRHFAQLEQQAKVLIRHLLALPLPSELLSFFFSSIRTRRDLKGQSTDMTPVYALHHEAAAGFTV